MDKVDVLVVGAGVIGLAIARRLAEAGREPVVLERHDGFGRETSSRNSEVIHCGMYYGESLLKTRLCVAGNPLLYGLCERNGIPFRRTGKIVVAIGPQEEEALASIHAQGKRNGVPGLRLISRQEIGKLEPDVSATLGLYSETSGIVDTHGLMAYLESSARTAGAVIAYNNEVTGLSAGSAGFEVEYGEPRGGRAKVRAARVVNAAGLGAERIAALAGIDCAAAGYTLHPCKGEYFRVSHRHKGRLTHLVYPLPTHVHLGAHAVLSLDGSLRIGPNSFYVDSLDYAVDPSHRQDFLEKAGRFLPFLQLDDLAPDQSGIRPKLYGPGQPFRDFVIREETDRGLPGLVDLIGMESPGLTSCLSIAEMVAGLL